MTFSSCPFTSLTSPFTSLFQMTAAPSASPQITLCVGTQCGRSILGGHGRPGRRQRCSGLVPLPRSWQTSNEAVEDTSTRGIDCSVGASRSCALLSASQHHLAGPVRVSNPGGVISSCDNPLRVRAHPTPDFQIRPRHANEIVPPTRRTCTFRSPAGGDPLPVRAHCNDRKLSPPSTRGLSGLPRPSPLHHLEPAAIRNRSPPGCPRSEPCAHQRCRGHAGNRPAAAPAAGIGVAAACCTSANGCPGTNESPSRLQRQRAGNGSPARSTRGR